MLLIDAWCYRLNSRLIFCRPGCQNRKEGFGGGQLDEKTREKIVASFENAMRTVGAQNYEDGVETVARLIRFASDGIETMRTPDQLRETLDRLPPLSMRERMMILFLMPRLPQLLRLGLKMLGEEAGRTLPAPDGGRPRSMSADTVEEALDYVCKLQRQGVRLEIAKLRTAQKFGCSLRTIERYWRTRDNPAE